MENETKSKQEKQDLKDAERSEALAQAYQERGEIEADRLANEANE